MTDPLTLRLAIEFLTREAADLRRSKNHRNAALTLRSRAEDELARIASRPLDARCA